MGRIVPFLLVHFFQVKNWSITPTLSYISSNNFRKPLEVKWKEQGYVPLLDALA